LEVFIYEDTHPMKVRWTAQSLRFRITPTELALLEDGQTVEARLALPGGEWQACAVPRSGSTSLAMKDARLRVTLTSDDIAQLSVPTTEGIYFATDDVPAVRYLVEKDFPCIHPHAGEAGEAPTETFAAPAGFEERKAE